MRRLPLTFVTSLAIAGCGGVNGDPGLDLLMRVPGGQLVRAALPAAAGGPAVTLVEVRTARVVPGTANNRVGGRTAAGGFAVNVAIDRESAYWIVPTGVEDPTMPGDVTWQAALDFA